MTSLYHQALSFYGEDNLKSLEIINEAERSDEDSDKLNLDLLQGAIFWDLGKETENPYNKITYFMAYLECFSRCNPYESAEPIFKIAELLGSVSHYKKFLSTAVVGLQNIAIILSDEFDENDNVYVHLCKKKKSLEELIETARSRIADPEALVRFPVSNCEQKVWESEEYEKLRKKNSDLVELLRPHWEGSSAETKRNFMKVSVPDLGSYALLKFSQDRKHGQDAINGQDVFKQVLSHAKKKRRWSFWLCRTCNEKFSTSDECTSHLEQVHAPKFKPSSRNDMAQKVSQVWADKISVGVWEPVDANTAVQMIRKDVKAFTYEDGWCNDWPVAEDENRSKVLNNIRQLLVSLCDHQILSQRIRDIMMHVVVKKLEVSKQILTDCGLLETPKSICFLEFPELYQIFKLLRRIKLKRRDGIDQVCRAVDSFCGGTRVKEKMDFDSNFSFLLLDKRLLQGNVDDRFDEEGQIRFIDPIVHCANARPSGDAFLPWLAVFSSGDERLIFPRPIKAHNLDIWGAALRACQFIFRTLETKHAQKMQLLAYGAALNDAKELCIRMYPQEGPEKRYATLLRSRFEEQDAESVFVCAIGDVLKRAKSPTLQFDDDVDSITSDDDDVKDSITSDDDDDDDDDDVEDSEPSDDDDDDHDVMNYIASLEAAVNNVVAQMDSETLLIEKSRVNLLESLTSLCVFDYRSYVYPPLKGHLLSRLATRFGIPIRD